MLMQQIPNAETILNFEQAIDAIITSIAAEETALSHIIDAESEKIQYAVERAGQTGADLHKLVRINESVADLLDRINDMQIILKSKMRLALKYKPYDQGELDCPDSDKPDPAVSRRDFIFSAADQYVWRCCTNLPLKEEYRREDGPALCCGRCGSMIQLPAGRKYTIEIELEIKNKTARPMLIELAFCRGCTVTHSQKYICRAQKYNARLTDTRVWETPETDDQNFLMLRPLSPNNLEIVSGKISVTETL